MTTETDALNAHLTASIALVATIAACTSSNPSATGVIDYPKANQVIQHVSNSAAIKITWRGAGTSVRVKQNGGQIAESATGNFTLSKGWYQAVLVNNNVEGDVINFGVGDVYMVAGQSNAVSPLQPSTYTVNRPLSAGRVIISDYYNQGRDSFVDAYSTPIVYPFGGVAWIACGIALNRQYPVMFVIVAQGNSSTTEWVNSYITRIFVAWAMYKPKAILWLQGENDAALSIPQVTSYTNMNAMISSLREVAITPWIIALNSQAPTYPPIRAAQQQVIDQWAHVYQGPDTDPFRHGQSEYLGADMDSVGQAFANSIISLGL